MMDREKRHVGGGVLASVARPGEGIADFLSILELPREYHMHREDSAGRSCSTSNTRPGGGGPHAAGLVSTSKESAVGLQSHREAQHPPIGAGTSVYISTLFSYACAVLYESPF